MLLTDKTLTYSGDEISLGAYTLTMSGGGRFSNPNHLDLNNTSSKLLLNSIIVDNVSTSSNSLGLDVDNNSTVTSLTGCPYNPGFHCIRQDTLRSNNIKSRIIKTG